MRLGAVVGLMIAAITVTQPVSARVTPTKGAAAKTKCPGWLRATQHAVSGQRALWTTALEDRDKHPLPILGSMGVHVEFRGTQPRVQSLEFNVVYLPAGLREMRDDPEADAKSAQEMKKTYSLIGGDKARVEGELLVGQASMVTRVELVSATFADGSEWHAASEGACSVEPNRVIPVDGKESSLEW